VDFVQDFFDDVQEPFSGGFGSDNDRTEHLIVEILSVFVDSGPKFVQSVLNKSFFGDGEGSWSEQVAEDKLDKDLVIVGSIVVFE
jgi:hypothetical protein